MQLIFKGPNIRRAFSLDEDIQQVSSGQEVADLSDWGIQIPKSKEQFFQLFLTTL